MVTPPKIRKSKLSFCAWLIVLQFCYISRRSASYRLENWFSLMDFTSDDAALMYARACRAWYGPRAHRVVKKRIGELTRVGDHEGVKAWSQVADQLAKLQSTQRGGE
jgi:hypothetical protein